MDLLTAMEGMLDDVSDISDLGGKGDMHDTGDVDDLLLFSPPS